MRVLLVTEWGWPGQELSRLLGSASGLSLTEVLRSRLAIEAVDPLDFDAILTFGPHTGRLLPLLRRIAGRSKSPTPRFLWWLNENLPDWGRPIRARAIARGRLALDDLHALRSGGTGKVQAAGHRYRILGEVLWGHRHGVLDVLAVSSLDRQRRLEAMGIPAVHAPMGYGPSDGLGRDLSLPRDRDVIWVGRQPTSARRRRAAALDTVVADLARRGITVDRHFHGLEGPARTEAMNRTKVIINLLRHSQDFTGHRLLLGAANRCLVVSEPMVDSVPFVPGIHLVQAPIDQMAERIEFYLTHEDERSRIVEAAHALVHGELTMRNALRRVFSSGGLELSWPDDRPA